MCENAVEYTKKVKDIPFIKLFRTPREYYFFDVNRNMICSVDKETYYELKEITENGQKNMLSDTICILKKEGWLSSHKPTKIRHEFTDKIDLWLENEVSQLLLQVTQACNLSCIYCPYAVNKESKLSRTHTNKTMTFDTAKKAIDFMAQKSGNADKISISFYGGEPLIAFPLIKKCVEYADHLFEGKPISYSLTTNATLITNEMIEYFASRHFYLTFSMDGPKNIHDSHRVYANGRPTYDLVIDILKKTVKCYGENGKGFILINMVLNPADSLDEILAWLDEPIIKDVMVQASFIEDDYLEKNFQMSSAYMEKFRYQEVEGLLDYLQLVKGLKSNPIVESIIKGHVEAYSELQNGAISLPDISCPGGPCLSGIKKLFVNVDGKFFPCEKVNELSPAMVIGNLQTGFDKEQIKRHLNIAQLTSDQCINCWAQSHCFTCQRRADDGVDLSAKEKSRFCNQIKERLISTLYITAMIKECKTIYKFATGGKKFD